VMVSGSVTPYSFLNVGYRIYELDVASKAVTDQYMFVFNMTEANLNGDQPPRWYDICYYL
jgi:hypothetical protein